MLSDRSSLDSQYISLTVTLGNMHGGSGCAHVCVWWGGGGGLHVWCASKGGGGARGEGEQVIYIYINLHSNFFTFYPRVL